VSARFLGRAWRRRARLGLPTVLGLGRGGFFLPYRYAGTLPGPGARPPYAAVERLFEGCRPSFRRILSELEAFAADLKRIGGDPPPAPRWSQSWFPRLDAAVAYALVRTLKPRRIVEVGSGHSTRFLARALADGRSEAQITAVDPAPRARLDALPVALERQTLQTAGMAPFRALASGDMLVIDSSHLLVPGSDVDFLLGRVLPEMPDGLWVHFHDIFLPDDYPAAWNWRGYNEQLGVLSLLLGGGWQVRFASRYVVSRMAQDLALSVAADLPLPEEAEESSLWISKANR
jgi:hypothetical protein